jgi:hypothetical protein
LFRSFHDQIQKTNDYFLVESVNFLVESVIFTCVVAFDVSVVTVLTLSVFTTVVESVLDAEEPDTQAANELIAKIVNNFFMLRV